MYNYNFNHYQFLTSQHNYSSFEELKAGACVSGEVVNIIANILEILENAQLLTVNSFQLYGKNVQQGGSPIQNIDRQRLLVELEALTQSNPEGIFKFNVFGSGLLHRERGRARYLGLLLLGFDLDNSECSIHIDTRDWLPAYIEEEGEEYDEYTDHHIVPEKYEANKGRLEAAYVAIEAATGLKQDIQDYFDTEYDWSYATEGRSFYTPRRIWELMREEYPWFDDMDIMPYLAPSEAQKYLAEQISPKIEKIRELASQRPLLAREQLELDILQKILQAENLSDIDLIIDNLKQTPTDTELRQRLLEKAAVKRNILLEKQSAFR